MRTTQEAIKDYKHICWYPSASNDFRPLLFLSDWYYDTYNVPRDEDQVMPDLFILSDLTGLHGWMNEEMYKDVYALIEQGICPPGTCLVEEYYHSTRTIITVKSFERLKDLPLTYDPALTRFEPSPAYKSSYLINVDVESRKFGITRHFDATVLYIAGQNESVAKDFLIPSKVKVEYQVLVRYGTGFGGANQGPEWIIRSYRDLGIKYLISNDEYLLNAMNGKNMEGAAPQYEELYSIDGIQWSKYGKVAWYKLS